MLTDKCNTPLVKFNDLDWTTKRNAFYVVLKDKLKKGSLLYIKGPTLNFYDYKTKSFI